MICKRGTFSSGMGWQIPRMPGLGGAVGATSRNENVPRVRSMLRASRRRPGVQEPSTVQLGTTVLVPAGAIVTAAEHMFDATQTAVVMATPMSSDICEATLNPAFPAMKKATAMMNDVNIAAISLHAVTRHQNQRNR